MVRVSGSTWRDRAAVIWSHIVARAQLGWMMWAVVACGMAANLAGAETDRNSHSYWEVSSRGLPDCPRSDCSHPLTVMLCHDRLWRRSTMNDLLDACRPEACGRVVIYVHGNWMTHSEARVRSQAAFTAVTRHSQVPVCFIAYSWPSEREKGFAKDVIGKKDRIDTESLYLAGFLSRLDAATPIGILGYSFGARVTCGSLHLLAGGELAGRSLPECSTAARCFRVSLTAPAFDRASLTSQGRYNRALSLVECMVNLYNSSDPILKRFRFFDRQLEPVAAGFAGLLDARAAGDAGGQPLQSSPNIRQYDCHAIGRTHAEMAYYDCPAIHRSIANVLGRE